MGLFPRQASASVAVQWHSMKPNAAALIRALGRGQSAESLGLVRTEEDLVDLRGARIPQMKVATGIPEREVFESLILKDIDLSKAALRDGVWQDCRLERVRFDGARLLGTSLRSGLITESSFRGASLRDTHWGLKTRPGPDVAGTDFSEADLRESTFDFPLFRDCRFSRTELRRVDFFGARFEGCVFEGLLDEVLFHGRWPWPEDPEVRDLRNPMTDVDFSRAELRWVEFDMGIDLSSCRLPTDGYLRVPRPRATYTSALRRIEREWTGSARTAGAFFLENILKHHPEEQPFTILRPRDLIESLMGHEVGGKLVDVIHEASREGVGVDL